jgi:hypothetical protein
MTVIPKKLGTTNNTTMKYRYRNYSGWRKKENHLSEQSFLGFKKRNKNFLQMNTVCEVKYSDGNNLPNFSDNGITQKITRASYCITIPHPVCGSITLL